MTEQNYCHILHDFIIIVIPCTPTPYHLLTDA